MVPGIAQPASLYSNAGFQSPLNLVHFPTFWFLCFLSIYQNSHRPTLCACLMLITLLLQFLILLCLCFNIFGHPCSSFYSVLFIQFDKHYWPVMCYKETDIFAGKWIFPVMVLQLFSQQWFFYLNNGYTFKPKVTNTGTHLGDIAGLVLDQHNTTSCSFCR